MKMFCLLSMVAFALIAQPESAASRPWNKPAAALAEQIAAILGPGQAHLTMRNLSTIPGGEIAAIRSLLEQALQTHGVLASGAESANTIRITLSENLRERLWVAEVIEGSETRVVMVRVEPGAERQNTSTSELTLHRQTLLTTTEPVPAALEIADSFVVVEPEEIVIYAHTAAGWQEQNRVGIGQRKPLVRDPRGIIFPSPDGQGFEASVAGTACSGAYQQGTPLPNWTIHCRESDDPWFLTPSQPGDAGTGSTENVRATRISAFYNAARNYFTGVVTSGLGVDLPPFYSAVLIPRPGGGTGLLLNGIDGKVQLLENGALKPIAGTRDWGSDFAVLHSGCGSGTQTLASGSGEALTDSLRGYELPAQEAIPASAPLAMDGTVTALWAAPDGKSVSAAVRKQGSQGQTDIYEVDRVSANCN
jgi:hypothetical protein